MLASDMDRKLGNAGVALAIAIAGGRRKGDNGAPVILDYGNWVSPISMPVSHIG
jgi:hypothetical protein